VREGESVRERGGGRESGEEKLKERVMLCALEAIVCSICTIVQPVSVLPMEYAYSYEYLGIHNYVSICKYTYSYEYLEMHT